MNAIKFTYANTQELSNLIEDEYFSNDNMGRRSDNPINHLILAPDDILYKILENTEYQVKLRNENIIDGSMVFNIKEEEGEIHLIPSSQFCVKTERNKYSFY